MVERLGGYKSHRRTHGALEGPGEKNSVRLPDPFVFGAFTAQAQPSSATGETTSNMSRGALIAIASALFALGLGTWVVLDRDSGEEATAEEAPIRKRGGKRPGARAQRGDSGLEERVADLEGEVARLRQDMKRLGMARGSVAARSANLEPDTPAGAEEPVFEGVVRDIIETEREEARERRTDALRDRFTERHSEILDELVAVASLQSTERESIESLWDTESEQLVPLFVAAREGDRPFAEVREEADKLRKATDTSVEEMLSAEQFEQYKELRPGPPGRGGRGRGGRGGRGGQAGQGAQGGQGARGGQAAPPAGTPPG